jgi:short-subunit dehydrogenase
MLVSPSHAADLVGWVICMIVSRNKEKGEAALAEIRQQRSTAEVDLLVGSLDTIASTKQLAQAIIDNYPQISVLINNAGVWMHQRIINDDGLEYSFMVNHMAHTY